MVTQRIPDPSDEERIKGIQLVLAELAQNGITSVQDNSTWDDFLAYRELKQAKKLTVRITEWLPFTADVDDLQNMRAEGRDDGPVVEKWRVEGISRRCIGDTYRGVARAVLGRCFHEWIADRRSGNSEENGHRARPARISDCVSCHWR